MPGQPGAREHRRTLAAVSPWAELGRVSQQAGRLGLRAAAATAALAGLVSSCSGSPPGCPCLLVMWARMLVPGVASLSPRHPPPAATRGERKRERLSGEET